MIHHSESSGIPGHPYNSIQERQGIMFLVFSVICAMACIADQTRREGTTFWLFSFIWTMLCISDQFFDHLLHLNLLAFALGVVVIYGLFRVKRIREWVDPSDAPGPAA